MRITILHLSAWQLRHVSNTSRFMMPNAQSSNASTWVDKSISNKLTTTKAPHGASSVKNQYQPSSSNAQTWPSRPHWLTYLLGLGCRLCQFSHNKNVFSSHEAKQINCTHQCAWFSHETFHLLQGESHFDYHKRQYNQLAQCSNHQETLQPNDLLHCLAQRHKLNLCGR